MRFQRSGVLLAAFVPNVWAQVEEAAPASNGHDHASMVVAEQTTEILRLSVSEAVMRLDLEHRTVMMFRNSGNGALGVVYRRGDGHVGWIDAPAG